MVSVHERQQCLHAFRCQCWTLTILAVIQMLLCKPAKNVPHTLCLAFALYAKACLLHTQKQKFPMHNGTRSFHDALQV